MVGCREHGSSYAEKMKPIHRYRGTGPFGVNVFVVGLMAVWSAQYLRVWPYPHWALNVVFLIWVIAAVALFYGGSAMRRANRGLVPPTAPEKLAQYRRLSRVSFFVLPVLGLLLIAPWIFEFYRPSPSIQAVLIVLGWTASMFGIWTLHRNRLKWFALMSEPVN